MKENMKKNKIFFVFSLVFTLIFVCCSSSMAEKKRLPNYPYTSYINDPHKDGRINNLDKVVHALDRDVTDGYNIAYTLLSSKQTYVIDDKDNHYESPDMNDKGDIVYVKEDNDDYFQVFLLEWKNGYDLDNDEEQITDDDFNHLNPGINNQGDIVWEQEDQIFLYTDQNIVFITDGEEPMINSWGEIVYAKWDGSHYQIFSTDRGQITSGSLNHHQPDVNDKGEIIWREEESEKWQIFSNVRNIDDDGQLTDDDDTDKYTPSINNNDILVWTEEPETDEYRVFWEDLGSINWNSRVEKESDSNTSWWELDGNRITQTAYDNGSFEIEDFKIKGDRAFWKYSKDGGPHYYCYYDLIYQGYYDGSNYITGYKRVTQKADGDWSITGFEVAGDRAFWKYSEDGGEHWYCCYDLITNGGPDRITHKASSSESITNFTVSGDRADWRYNGYNYYRDLRDLPDGDIIRVSSGGGGGTPWNPWNPMPWNPMPWNPMPWNPIPWNPIPWNPIPWMPSLTPSWMPSLTPSWMPSLTPSWIPSLTPSWTPSWIPSLTPSWTPSWNTNWNSGFNTGWNTNWNSGWNTTGW